MLSDGLAQEGMHRKESLKVRDILCEDVATTHIAAAKHTHSRVDGFKWWLAKLDEIAKEFDEIGAVFGFANGDDAQGKPSQAT